MRRPLQYAAIGARIRAALLAAAGEAEVYLVGGAVRDAWLGRPGRDWDIVVSAAARPIARRTADALGGVYYPIDAERDVGRVLLREGTERQTIDIATFRSPPSAKSDERLAADLGERDFTINALAVDWRGDDQALIDPCGGEKDLLARRLRLCHDAALLADPLRALRGLRLAGQFGLAMTVRTKTAIREAASLLHTVSAERRREEWSRLLSLRNAASALRAAQHLGLLAEFLPWSVEWVEELRGGGRTRWDERLDALARLAEIHAVIDAGRSDDATANFALGMLAIQLGGLRARLQGVLLGETGGTTALRALAALLAGVDKAELRAWGQFWRYSGAQIRWLVSVTATAPAHGECLRAGVPADLCAHRYWRARGAAGIERALLELALALALPPQEFDQATWLSRLEEKRRLLRVYFEEHERLVMPTPLVDGHELMATLGLPPGPLVGELLEKLREAQVLEKVQDSASALALARRLLAKN